MINLNWIFGVGGTILAGVVLFLIKRVVELPEKYIQKEDFVRVMLENRQDHQLMFGKLDNVLEKLRE